MEERQGNLFGSVAYQKFKDHDRANPRVWELLVQFTMRAIDRGFKHYGVKAVFEVIRWHTAVETNDPTFKVNNNYAPWYARKFHAEYPQHDGFFRTRTAEADDWEDEL